MEKFFHTDIREVEAFEEFLGGDWQLFDCRIDGSASHPVTPAAIKAYFHQTQDLWGGYPENYILAIRGLAPAATNLAEIMESLNHTDQDEIIALVGYNDGGVISLSRTSLPPQRGAKSADWWTGNFHVDSRYPGAQSAPISLSFFSTASLGSPSSGRL